VAPLTAVHESVRGPGDTKAPLTGAVLDAQPGTDGGGGGLVPPFLLHELIMITATEKSNKK
jgi:hypothetical protein